jgi:flavin-dependent dehydrogenase
MSFVYDVIIIGAGPAGLTLAGRLDPKLKVLLLEKKLEPHKLIACAEWVPPNMPVEPVTITNAMITEYAGKSVTKDFTGKIIDRESWQKSLLESLTHTDIRLGETVTDIQGNVIRTKKRTYEGKITVGSDGPLSVVRKTYGLPVAPVMPAINVRMRLKKKLDSTLIHFMPEIEKGYGWLFPKGDIANVGVGTTSKLYDAIKFYIQYLINNNYIYPEIILKTAGLIPLYGFSPVASENAVLLGDAAGLTDPLTGAGIFQAWDSAVILAEVINSGKSISEYAKRIKIAYGSFLARRMTKRKIFEDNWGNLTKAVEESWVSFGR